MKHAYLITLLSLFLVLSNTIYAQTPEFYNDFNGTSYNIYPLGTSSQDKVQWVYEPNLFNSNGPSGTPAPAGYISTVYFKLGTSVNPSTVYSDFTISLGQNVGTLTSFTSSTWITGLTTCFYQSSYSLTGATATSWYEVELQTPFYYDPSLSLIVELKQANSTGTQVAQVNTTGMNHRIWGDNLSSPNGTNTGTGLVNFGVNISNPQVPNDAGITALLSPTLPACAGTYPLSVVVKNFGNNQVSPVTINWSLNNVPQTPFIYNGTLDTLNGLMSDTAHVSIGMLNLTSATTLKIWTSLPNNVNDTVGINDTLPLELAPALEGIYVIGSSVGADYASFTEAVADLEMFGVCDTVVFEVEDGSYNEQISLGEIDGVTEYSPVYFRGQNLDSTLAIITYQSNSSSNNYVVQFSGADHITFEHLTMHNTYTSTYASALHFAGGSDSNTIQNCVIKTDYSGTSYWSSAVLSPSGSQDEYNTIRNNLIEGGSYGTYWYGTNTSTLERGTVFEGNKFRDQYYFGANLYYQDAPQFVNNSITSNSTYTSGYGLQMGYCDNAMRVEGNHIYTSPNTVWPYYGMRIYYSDGTPTEMGSVSNNIIALGTETSSGNTFYAMYPYYSYFQKYANNTAVIRNGSTSSTAIYTLYNYNNEFYNNIAVNYGNGYALYSNYGDSPADMNNNAYFTSSSTFAYWYGQTPSDLTGLQTASGFDGNSLEVDPVFSDTIMGLHCSEDLNGAALPFMNVTEDFYKSNRNPTTPDIGALEYLTPLSISLGPDTTICGDQYALSLFGTGSISWAGGNTLGSGNTYLLTAGNASTVFNPVTVVYQSEACGILDDEVVITLVPNADLDDSLNICADETATLTSSTGSASASYLWLPSNEQSQSIQVSQAGIHKVIKTEDGCVSEDLIIVSQSDAIALENYIVVCEEELPLTLDATIDNGVTYTWSGGTTPNAPLNIFQEAGTYTVSAEDSYGCVNSLNFELDVIALPNPQITFVNGGFTYIFTAASNANVGQNATYEWVFSDDPLTIYTGMTVTHTFPFSSGAVGYNVLLSITNECGNKSTNKIIPVDPLGQSELASESNVMVFPNPTDQYVNVKIENATESAISLKDIQGREVLVLKNLDAQKVQRIDLTGIASGSYMLEVQTDLFTDQQILIIK